MVKEELQNGFLQDTAEIISFYKKIGYPWPVHPTQLYPFLYEKALPLSVKRYGEIGSHIGCSMSYVSLVNPDTEIFCFDAPNNGWGGHEGTDGFLSQAISEFASGRAKTFFGNSHSPEIKQKIKENGPYDLFLIDGDHSYDGALEDFLAVIGNMNPGGVIVMDDLMWHTDALNRLFDDLLKKFNLKGEKFLELSDFEKKNDIHFRGVGAIYL